MLVLKKLVFLTVLSIVGFFALLLATILIFETGILSDIEGLAGDVSFRYGYFGGMMWSLIAGIVIGIFYLFVESPKARWFLWAPIYIPMLYIMGAVAYFS